jgi:hypothetical protein
MSNEKTGKPSSWSAALAQLPGYPREELPTPAVPAAPAPARTVTPMKGDDEGEEPAGGR